MKLYFKNSNGKKRLIARPKNEKDALDVIYTFCEKRNFTIHYVRSYSPDKITKIFDVGSHTEFFYLEQED